MDPILYLLVGALAFVTAFKPRALLPWLRQPTDCELQLFKLGTSGGLATQAAAMDPSATFFGQTRRFNFDPEGGFSHLQRPRAPWRYPLAVVVLSALLVNLFVLAGGASDTMTQSARPLISKAPLMRWMRLSELLPTLPMDYVMLARAVGSIEMVGLFFFALSICTHGVMVASPWRCLPRQPPRDGGVGAAFAGEAEFLRWLAVSSFFTEVYPILYGFSALRLLHIIHPVMLSRDLHRIFTSYTAGSKLCVRLLLFLGGRLLILLFGIEVFMLKVTYVLKAILCENAGLPLFAGLHVPALVVLVALLHQTIESNVVVIQRRRALFGFLFAEARSGVMERDLERERAWLACYFKRLWEVSGGPLTFLTWALTFTEVDIQDLVLA